MSLWPDGSIAAFAETIVAYRLVMALGIATPRSGWPFWVILSAHLAGQVAAGYAGAGSTDRFRKRLLFLWLIPGVAVGFFTLFHRATGLGISVVCALVWLSCSGRGVAWATGPRDFHTMRRDMSLGAAMLAYLSYLGRANDESNLLEIVFFLLLYSAVLVIKRRREVPGLALSAKEKASWAVSAAAFMGLSFAVVFVLYVLGPGGLEAVRATFRLVWQFAVTMLSYALMPLAYLAQWLITVISRMLPDQAPEVQEIETVNFGEIFKDYMDERNPVALPQWVKVSALLVVFFAAVYGLWRLIARFSGLPNGEDASETRTSLAGSDAPKEWLSGAVDGLAGLASAFVTKLRSVVEGEPRTLEGVYRATLLLLASRGLPKEPRLTPYEYSDLVGDEIPTSEGKEALEQMTVVFTECFYSERRPLKEELLAARKAYRIIAGAWFRGG